MRLADVLLYNWPHLMVWDRYAGFPEAHQVGFHPLMSGGIFVLSWIGTLGNPTIHSQELVGAFLPPVLGGLTLIPVFFLCKELFKNNKVGMLAVGLIAILPGEFLHRSLLGYTDQHAAETLLMVTTILFLVLARSRENWKWAIGSGVALGLYTLNWAGSTFFYFILLVWFTIEFVFRHLKSQSTISLCRTFSLTFIIAMAVSGWFLPKSIDLKDILALGVAGIMLPWLLQGITQTVTERKKFIWIVIGLWSIAGVGARLVYGKNPLNQVFWGFGSSISEALPSDLNVIMATAGVAFFLFVVGLYFYLKDKNQQKSILFIVWAVILFLADIGQRRWGYYFVAPMAILASWMTFYSVKWVAKNMRVASLAIIIMFTVVPSIKGTVGITNLPNNITPEWVATCEWLKNETPPVFYDNAQDPYSRYSIKEEPNYSILSWWDYGHWIIRIGERVPLSSPTNQGVLAVPYFFVAQTTEDAESMIASLKVKYVIVTSEMISDKFYAMVDYARGDISLTDELRLNSMAMRLWQGQVTGYSLVFQTPNIKVFEKE